MCGQASQTHLLPRSRIASHSAFGRLPCLRLLEGTAKHERLARLALPDFAAVRHTYAVVLDAVDAGRRLAYPPHAPEPERLFAVALGP